MTLNQLQQQIVSEAVKELDQEFLTNPKKKSCYLSGDEKREIVKYYTTTLTQAMRKVAEETVKKSKGIYHQPLVSALRYIEYNEKNEPIQTSREQFNKLIAMADESVVSWLNQDSEGNSHA